MFKWFKLNYVFNTLLGAAAGTLLSGGTPADALQVVLQTVGQTAADHADKPGVLVAGIAGAVLGHFVTKENHAATDEAAKTTKGLPAVDRP